MESNRTQPKMDSFSAVKHIKYMDMIRRPDHFFSTFSYLCACAERHISNISKKEQIIIMGESKAKIGKTKTEEHLKGTVGKYRIVNEMNEVKSYSNLSLNSDLSIMYTMFKHHLRRLSTWTSQVGRYKNEIDYILVNKRWKSSVINIDKTSG